MLFIDQQFENPQQEIVFPISILGDPGVGCTSFIKALCQSSDKENGSASDLNSGFTAQNVLTTFGFKSNCTIKFEFATQKLFNSGVYGTIILYDITNYESFLRLKQIQRDLKSAEFGYLIGTKSDLESSRQVMTSEANEYAIEQGLLFSEVSSFKRKNIEMVLKMIKSRVSKAISEGRVKAENRIRPFQERRISPLPTVEANTRIPSTKNLDTAQFLENASNYEPKDIAEFQGQDEDLFYNKRQLLSSILQSNFYKSSDKLISEDLERKKLDFDENHQAKDEEDYEDMKLLETLEKRFSQLDQEQEGKNILSELQRAMEKYNDFDYPYTPQPKVSLNEEGKLLKVEQIDRDIKKTEETLKSVNQRFNLIKLAQPSNFKGDLPRQQLTPNTSLRVKSRNAIDNRQVGIPVFETTLYKPSHEQRASFTKTPIKTQNMTYNSRTSRNPSNNIPEAFTQKETKQQQLVTTSTYKSQTREIHHKDKPLMQVRIKLRQEQFVLANVYKDDTPITVAERVLRNGKLLHIKDLKEKKQILANLVEQQINDYIQNFRLQVDKDFKASIKKKQHQEQNLREKRLHMASQQSIDSLNTAKRQQIKEEKRERILGRLSILLGNSKKGDILVREGDSLQQLAKNFVASYGLKREFIQSILSSLEQLVQNNKSKPLNKHAMSQSQSSYEEQELNIPAVEANQSHHMQMHHNQSFSSFQNQTEVSQYIKKQPNIRVEEAKEILFRLNFELGEGKSAKLTVKQGDDFMQLARQFVLEHSLEYEAVEKVYGLIEQTYKVHLEKQQ
ncbi:hypothetical protein FGO68_gene11856 [Halteria grandinella]|uniref:Uncharacterized protein n=1 Tax=Halteria grandinella TaxID=5974 RepID=A0A8J8P167_HALGN|nr:hypothetical protein FGO68_gene11856 [Halteria grandinella]